MNDFTQCYKSIASLFLYPGPKFADAIQRCHTDLRAACPAACEKLEPFSTYVSERRIADLEELYAQTFDNSVDLALECGWHLHGETYERGAFLVNMRQRLREAGIPENGELPDHITHVLLLAERSDEEEASLLIHDVAVPALKKVREHLRAQDHPYLSVLDACFELFTLQAPSPTAGFQV